MKATVAASAMLIASAAAQTVLPNCAQDCINGMLRKAQALGCATADANCLCTKANFGYGVRDCSAESCPVGTDLGGLAAFVYGYCGSGELASTSLAAVTIFGNVPGGQGASSTLSAGVNFTPAASVDVTTSALATSTRSSGASQSQGVSNTSSRSAIATEPLLSVVTSGASTFTTTVGQTTLFPPASAVTTEARVTTETTSGRIVVSTISGSSQTIYAIPVLTILTESNGSIVTSTVGTSTVGGPNGVIGGAGATQSASSGISSVGSSVSSRASSASNSASSVASSVGSSASSLASSASSRASSVASSASTAAAGATSSGIAAPMITMAAQGFAGVAGLAAVMLL